VFESYGQSVSAADGAEFDKSVIAWAHDYLSLIALRPGMLKVNDGV